jgi:hypothetical protein
MNQDIRRELIGKNLGIKPINHGQVYTFQVALPDSRKQALSLERRQAIEQSLLAHQSNLMSLVVRRTTAYSDDDIEYEVLHGADWLQIAQELEIEKLWAWVFDLTDEQAIATIAEMESLTPTQEGEPSLPSSTSLEIDLATLIDKKLQLATDSIKHSLTPLLTGIRQELDEKLKVLNYKIDSFNSNPMDLASLTLVLEKLEMLQQGLTSSRKFSSVEPIENPINLMDASDREIEKALRQINTQDSQIRAAIAAVQSCRESEQGLMWKNLERAAKSNSNSPFKVKGFGIKTYDRLWAIATPPET